LILMYRKADQIFKSAVIRQNNLKIRRSTFFLEKSKRILPQKISDKIRTIPSTLPRGHVVTAILRDGERISNVFVLDSSEILGVYDRSELDFEAQDIADIEPLDWNNLPAYDESKWLRLDG